MGLPPISHPSHPSSLAQSIGLSAQSAAELLYKPWEKGEKKNQNKEINRAGTLVPFLLSIRILFFLLRYESLGQAPLACSAYLGWSSGQPNPLDACPHLTPEGWLLAPLLLDFWIAHLAWQAWAFDFWKSLTSSTQTFSMTSSWPSTVYPALELYLLPCPGWQQMGRGYVGRDVALPLISSTQLWGAQRESSGVEVIRAQGIYDSPHHTVIRNFWGVEVIYEWQEAISDHHQEAERGTLSEIISSLIPSAPAKPSLCNSHVMKGIMVPPSLKICKIAFMLQSNNNLIKPNIYNGRI